MEKGSVTAADADAARERITIADSIEQLAEAHVIVEAIVERLDIKQELFAQLDALAPPDTIVASNTSSLPITAIAAKCQRPDRVAGLHFFNPVPLMKLVEVIPGLKTASWVTDALMAIARRMTREPVLCADSPGFIVNHVGRAYLPGGCTDRRGRHCQSRRDRSDHDRCSGHAHGPFTLLDLVGADVSVAVMESLWSQFYSEPMYAPQAILRLRVDAGLYGQKSGSGWYDYKDGKKVAPAPVRRPQSRRDPFGCGRATTSRVQRRAVEAARVAGR